MLKIGAAKSNAKNVFHNATLFILMKMMKVKLFFVVLSICIALRYLIS